MLIPPLFNISFKNIILFEYMKGFCSELCKMNIFFYYNFNYKKYTRHPVNKTLRTRPGIELRFLA